MNMIIPLQKKIWTKRVYWATKTQKRRFPEALFSIDAWLEAFQPAKVTARVAATIAAQ